MSAKKERDFGEVIITFILGLVVGITIVIIILGVAGVI